MMEIDEVDEVNGDEEKDDSGERIQDFTRGTDRALQGSTVLVDRKDNRNRSRLRYDVRWGVIDDEWYRIGHTRGRQLVLLGEVW